jgi:hypothetical protein
VRLLAGAIAVLLVLAAAACGGSKPKSTTSTSSSARSIDVQFQEQNFSGEAGTATLTAEGSKTRVVILMASSAANPQPAHIHKGTCDSLGAIAYPLPNIAQGKSTTVVPVSLDTLLKGKYAINVHRSAKKLNVYVACGNITENAAPVETITTGEEGSG